MIEFIVFLTTSIVLAVVGIRLVRVARKGIGEIVIGLSLLLGMFGTHAYHWKDKETASENLAASYVILERRLESGEVAEVRDILNHGIQAFMRGRTSFAATTERFWVYTIEHPNATVKAEAEQTGDGNEGRARP